MLIQIMPVALVLLVGETLPTTMPPEDQRVHFAPDEREHILDRCRAQRSGKEQERVQYCTCVLDNVSKYVTQQEYDDSTQAATLAQFYRLAPVTTRVITYCLEHSKLNT